MKPDPSRTLMVSAGQLLAGVVPRLGADYSAGSTATIALLMLFAAREQEEGAEIRVRENEAIRLLFARAVTILPAGALRSRLAHAAATEEESLRISALDASNAALKDDLMVLHCFVEEWDDPRAGRLNREIWRLMRNTAKIRTVTLPAL